MWLAVFGAGVDDFVFDGRMTPDDGAHRVMADDLARYAAGATVHVFLQHVDVRPLRAEGLAPGSSVSVEAVSSTSVVVP